MEWTGRLAATWRRLPAPAQDGLLGLGVVVAWYFGTSVVERSLWGGVDSGLPAWLGQAHGVAMWSTAMAITLRRMAPPWLLLAGVLVYPIVLPGALSTEFHLLPILIVAYSVAQSGDVRPVVVGLVSVAGAAMTF